MKTTVFLLGATILGCLSSIGHAIKCLDGYEIVASCVDPDEGVAAQSFINDGSLCSTDQLASIKEKMSTCAMDAINIVLDKMEVYHRRLGSKEHKENSGLLLSPQEKERKLGGCSGVGVNMCLSTGCLYCHCHACRNVNHCQYCRRRELGELGLEEEQEFKEPERINRRLPDFVSVEQLEADVSNELADILPACVRQLSFGPRGGQCRSALVRTFREKNLNQCTYYVDIGVNEDLFGSVCA